MTTPLAPSASDSHDKPDQFTDQSSIKTLCFLDQGDFLGGAEVFQINLIRYLCENTPHKIVLIGGRCEAYKKILGTHPQLLHREFETHSINPKTLLQTIKTAWSLRKLIAEIQPDWLQSNTVRMHMLCLFAGLNRSRTAAFMMHDVTMSPKIFRLLRNDSNSIFPVSRMVGDFYGIPFRPDILQNTVKTQAFTHSHAQNTPPKACMIGRIDSWKGQHIALQALQEVQKTVPAATLDIHGHTESVDPESQAYITNVLKQGKETPWATFCGFYLQKDLPKILAQYDILIHASTLPEPFGITVIEGMAARLACIGSNIGGPLEIITHGVDGMLFEAGNPQSLAQVWLELLTDDDLRQSLAQAGQQTAYKYDQSTVLRRYLDYIEHTISQK